MRNFNVHIKIKYLAIRLGEISLFFFLLFQLYLSARLYMFTSCIIPTGSMSPTLVDGDYIIVSLQIPGRRVWEEDKRGGYKVTRKKGYREVQKGDVVVFNFPYAKCCERMILCNDLFYCKRCVATPGQTYSWMMGGQMHRLYLPNKGYEVFLDSIAWDNYHRCIEYETGQSLSLRGDSVLLGDSVVSKYRFQHDYYFMRGDNVSDSYDSRFWGPLPDDFILGIGRFIWFSKKTENGKICWDRMFKRL